ncbi:hypothetical protein MJM59_32595, partial [Salmonella enterica subsp. enterica serovar Montevideo]|nr:hypothetical protein [Salmonella enterica subsp. enterica serovar Montevideo]
QLPKKLDGLCTLAKLDAALAAADVLVMLVDHDEFKAIPGDAVRTLTSHLRAQIWGFTLPYSRRRKAGDPQALHAACAQELARLT